VSSSNDISANMTYLCKLKKEIELDFNSHEADV